MTCNPCYHSPPETQRQVCGSAPEARAAPRSGLGHLMLFPKTDLVGKTSRPSCKQGIPAPPSSTHGAASLPPTSSRELLARRHCTQACRRGQHLLTLVGKWQAAYREHVVLQKLRSRGAQLTLANRLGMGCCLHAEGQGRDATCMCTLGEGAARHKPGCEWVASQPCPGPHPHPPGSSESQGLRKEEACHGGGAQGKTEKDMCREGPRRGQQPSRVSVER